MLKGSYWKFVLCCSWSFGLGARHPQRGRWAILCSEQWHHLWFSLQGHGQVPQASWKRGNCGGRFIMWLILICNRTCWWLLTWVCWCMFSFLVMIKSVNFHVYFVVCFVMGMACSMWCIICILYAYAFKCVYLIKMCVWGWGCTMNEQRESSRQRKWKRCLPAKLKFILYFKTFIIRLYTKGIGLSCPPPPPPPPIRFTLFMVFQI